jgi:hypothetical protein
VTVTKHGFDSRWGHDGDFVVIFAPEFQSPGGRDLILFSLPIVVESFQSLPSRQTRRTVSPGAGKHGAGLRLNCWEAL